MERMRRTCGTFGFCACTYLSLMDVQLYNLNMNIDISSVKEMVVLRMSKY